MIMQKQINSDRMAPGITTSAVSGVRVNVSCDYKLHFLGAGVALTLQPSCAEASAERGLQSHAHTRVHTNAHTHEG